MGTTETTPESMKRQPTMAFVRRHYAQGPTAYYMDGSIVRMPTPADIEYAGQQFDHVLEAHDAEVARKTAERAWDECSSAWANRQIVAEAIISRAAECVREAYLRDQVAAVLSNTLPERPVNPYRAEQIGEEG